MTHTMTHTNSTARYRAVALIASIATDAAYSSTRAPTTSPLRHEPNLAKD
jgi:hypothetical protein